MAERDAPRKAPPPLQDARRGRFKVNLFGAGGTKDRMNIANESTGGGTVGGVAVASRHRGPHGLAVLTTNYDTDYFAP
jgi:hypothetical protein